MSHDPYEPEHLTPAVSTYGLEQAILRTASLPLTTPPEETRWVAWRDNEAKESVVAAVLGVAAPRIPGGGYGPVLLVAVRNGRDGTYYAPDWLTGERLEEATLAPSWQEAQDRITTDYTVEDAMDGYAERMAEAEEAEDA